MTVFLLSFLIVSLAILGMAVGTLAGRPPITGSCGGVERIDGTEFGCKACRVEAAGMSPGVDCRDPACYVSDDALASPPGCGHRGTRTCSEQATAR